MKLLLHILLISQFVLNYKNSKAQAYDDHLVIIDENFENEVVNSKVFKMVDWQFSELPSSGRQKYLRSTFEKNEYGGFTFLCNSFDYDRGWVYLEIVNKTTSRKFLTLTTEKVKCDALKMYLLRDDELTLHGSIQRETPLSDRYYNTFDFAFPIYLDANEKLGVILESHRRIGVNELAISIISESNYKSQIVPNLVRSLGLMIFGLVTACLLLGLALIYNNSLLFSIGIYLIALSIGFATLFSFHDTLDFPEFLALDASSMLQFAPLFCNLFIYPFLLNLRKQYVSSQKYFYVLILFFTINLILVGFILFTTRFNEFITTSYNYFMVLNLLLVFHEVIVFTMNTKRFFFLWAAVLGLGTNLMDTVYRFLVVEDHPVISMINYSLAPFGIILLAIAGVNEIRYGLITKENHEKALRYEREQLEDIRKNEIEIIGRNLHDNIGNSLASILGFLALRKPDVVKVQKLIRNVLKDLRVISHSFVKDENLLLIQQIENLVERLNDTSSINFKFLYSENQLQEILLPFQQQNLFFIIQEILINALKHASPTVVSVQLIEDKTEFLITIEDDGVGFNSDYSSMDGIGIPNILKRAELSNFKISIDSSASGTCTIIQVVK